MVEILGIVGFFYALKAVRSFERSRGTLIKESPYVCAGVGDGMEDVM